MCGREKSRRNLAKGVCLGTIALHERNVQIHPQASKDSTKQ
jgi:hypothetical protein